MTGRRHWTPAGIGAALMALALLSVVIAVWWWALAGMASEIGVAVGVTAFVTAATGVMIWTSDL